VVGDHFIGVPLPYHADLEQVYVVFLIFVEMRNSMLFNRATFLFIWETFLFIWATFFGKLYGLGLSHKVLILTTLDFFQSKISLNFDLTIELNEKITIASMVLNKRFVHVRTKLINGLSSFETGIDGMSLKERFSSSNTTTIKVH
jgi:hypothetical protein